MLTSQNNAQLNNTVLQFTVLALCRLVFVSLVGTAFLWWTYAQERAEVASNNKFHFPILDIDIKNETAFLGFSITATVLTVGDRGQH